MRPWSSRGLGIAVFALIAVAACDGSFESTSTAGSEPGTSVASTVTTAVALCTRLVSGAVTVSLLLADDAVFVRGADDVGRWRS